MVDARKGWDGLWERVTCFRHEEAVHSFMVKNEFISLCVYV